jgi:hypothetical protein
VQSKHVPPHLVASESAAQIDMPGQVWKLVLHVKPHLPEAQVAVPPVGAEQSVQEVPQLAASVSDAHALPHGCDPGLQLKPHFVLSQVGVLFAGTGHAVHELVPQFAVSPFDTQVPPQA